MARTHKKLSIKAKLRIIFLCVLAFIILTLLYLNYIVNPVIISATESKVRSLTQKAVGEAIYEVMHSTNVYSELINIHHDNEGNVTMISSKTFEINQLSRELLDNAQNKLDNIGNEGVEVGLGTFTGLPIFVNMGPPISIKMMPIGNIYTKFSSEFMAAGINQTIHKLFLTVETNISIILPISEKKVKTTTQVLIAESVIVGKIPEVYLNSNQLDEMLNLIP